MNNIGGQLRGLLVLSALCAFVLASCESRPEKQVFSARGVVKNLIENGKGVRIAHDEIPDFMKAMTMDFEVKDPALLTGLQPEDAIAFTLEKTSESLYITKIERLAASQAELTSTEAEDSGLSDAEEAAAATTEPEFSPYPAANFTLTDQDGQPFSLASSKGKVVLLDFIFTRCPGPCPLLSLKFSQLQKQLQERLGKDVLLLSVTIDPRHDTPEVLKDYAKRYDANLDSWKFLTGNTRDIILTATAFGADYKAGSEGIIDHRLLTCVINRDGIVVKEFTGTNYTVDELVAEIDQLLS